MSANLVNHIREGSGEPPIVFVHGYLCDHDNWRFQIPHFKATNMVLACDLRGLGKTALGDGEMSIEQMGRDLANLLGHYNLRNAVLVGHSMGCRVIMEANRHVKERVGGLVLVDGSRGGQDRVPDQAKFDMQIANFGYSAFVEGLFEGMFFGDAPGWKEDALDAVFGVSEEIGKPLYRNLIAWDAEQFEPALAQIDAPVLILQSTYINLDRQRKMLGTGENSPYQDLITSRHSGVTSVTLPAGHFTMIERPDETNVEISRFLTSLIS